MIEAYRIGVSLLLETNINSVLSTALKDLERLEKAVQGARDSAKGLAGALRQVGGERANIVAMAGAMDRMAGAMERMGKAAPAAGAGAAGMAQAAASAARDYSTAASAAERISRSSPSQGLAGPRAAPLLLTYDPPGGRAMTATGRGYSWGDRQFGPYPSQDPRFAGGAGGSGGGGGRGYDFPVGFPAPDEPFDPGPIPLPGGKRGGKGVGMHDATMAGVGAGAAGYAGWEIIKNVFEAGADMGKLRTILAEEGFDKSQVGAAYSASVNAQQNIPGAGIAEAMQIIAGAKTFLGSPDEAIKIMPSLEKLAIVLGQQGKGDQLHELEQALQAGELRGSLTKPGTAELDIDRLNAFLNNVQASTIATGGRVGPSEILQVLKSGGVYGAMLSDPGLFGEMIAPILSLGAAQAGTALQGFQMQFSAGKMSQASAGELQEMGFLKPGKWQKVPIGQIWVDPKTIPEMQNLREHPVQWVHDTLMPFLHKMGEKKIPGFDLMSPQRQIQEEQNLGARITSRIPGGKFIGDILRDWGMISRYLDQYQQGTQRDAYGIAQAQNPQIQVKAFDEAWKGLMIALGDPNVGAGTKALQDLTGGLNAITNWTKANPGAARALFDVAAGLAAVGGVAGTLLIGLAPLVALAKVAGAGGKLLGLSMGPRTALGASRVGLLAGGLGPFAVHEALGDPTADVNKGTNWGGLTTAVNPWAAKGSGFNIWDRSTWADPKGSAFFAAPKQTDAPQNVQMHGDVNLDGKKVGAFVAEGMAKAAEAPPAGPTAFNPRLSPIYPNSSP